MTKAILMEAIKSEGKAISPAVQGEIFAKHMQGRQWIWSRVKKSELEGIYEDIVNYKSDNRIA